MHFVALLDDRFQKIGRTKRQVDIEWRGYRPQTWVPAELSGIELPVNSLAYNVCPTHRDIYLEFVQHLQRPPTWERYRGRLIDEVYKTVHRKCAEYVLSHSVNQFALYEYLVGEQDNILQEVKREHRPELRGLNVVGVAPQTLDEELKRIIRFEAEITSALVAFQIAKVKSGSPRRIFDRYFMFNTDLPLNAPHQGFRGDATPDFIYRNNVVGDIKSGKWQEFFYYTIAAYALAYEEHTNEDMNYGVILHLEKSNRRVPLHYRTRIELIDDAKRERFCMVRNRKLEIVQARIIEEILKPEKYAILNALSTIFTVGGISRSKEYPSTESKA